MYVKGNRFLREREAGGERPKKELPKLYYLGRVEKAREFLPLVRSRILRIY